jgi:hypothetical protein
MELAIDRHYEAQRGDVLKIGDIRYEVFSVLPHGVRAGNGIHLEQIDYRDLISKGALLIARGSEKE